MKVGAVIIGRNEGDRLKRCLHSLPAGIPIVYVDSGSRDGSVEFAESVGARVISIAEGVAFTAAKARNLGWKALLEDCPQLDVIQFIDGDCEVFEGWWHRACEFLAQERQYAVVCGRRKERYPERSVYNWLCDLEWNTPVGDAKACGGDAMIRVDALVSVDGYKDDLIAGEEPEMCVRLRKQGYKIYRIDQDMTWHDANMQTFRQWWRRSTRCGFAYANGVALHGGKPEKHWLKETQRAILWALVVPASIVILVAVLGPSGFIFVLVYPLSFIRVALKAPIRGRKRWVFSAFLIISKFSETVGIIKFVLAKLKNRTVKIIE